MTDLSFHPSILRAYDIRGTFGENLFPQDATLLGQKIAAYFKRYHPSKTCTMGIVRDGRHSSPALHKVLIESLLCQGIHVLDFGVGPSPLGYYASFFEKIEGLVVITASHNPKQDNGFKILLLGQNICGDALHAFASLPACPSPEEKGHYHAKNIFEDYIQHTRQALAKTATKLRVAWDFGHGAMSVLAPYIKKYIPGEHFFLCETLNGDFPSHEPDPTVEKNLALLKECVVSKGCAIGFAFDGDGDRLGVVDHTGAMIAGDRLVTLLGAHFLKNQPGTTVLADIKSSMIFKEVIEKNGGVPLLTRSGHSFIKTKMKETGALFAGEMSGHLFFADENKGYDDGLYAALRVLRMLDEMQMSLHELNNALPSYDATPEIKLSVEVGENFATVERVKKDLIHQQKSFSEEDGVRFETDKGWWLIRASNTGNHLIVRMEGRTQDDLEVMKADCKSILKKALNGTITLEF